MPWLPASMCAATAGVTRTRPNQARDVDSAAGCATDPKQGQSGHRSQVDAAGDIPLAVSTNPLHVEEHILAVNASQVAAPVSGGKPGEHQQDRSRSRPSASTSRAVRTAAELQVQSHMQDPSAPSTPEPPLPAIFREAAFLQRPDISSLQLLHVKFQDTRKHPLPWKPMQGLQLTRLPTDQTIALPQSAPTTSTAPLPRSGHVMCVSILRGVPVVA
mmetsp:Transcript_162242/g.311515  ORF Transcript_162242/g.311515 Transcript_162242/m.311515 type:complete len:216 (-) Transcript_162242:602-1249(-)